jgi:hypothetical protein
MDPQGWKKAANRLNVAVTGAQKQGKVAFLHVRVDGVMQVSF